MGTSGTAPMAAMTAEKDSTRAVAAGPSGEAVRVGRGWQQLWSLPRGLDEITTLATPLAAGVS